MDAELQSHVAFHLTGKRPATGLDAVAPLSLRPALLARYRDLNSLRHDFPLVLVEGVPADGCVQALSGVIDEVLQQVARGEDGERVTRHVLRLEREMRTLVARGSEGSLSALWEVAAGRLLGARADDLLKDSLARARAALKVDGELVDCDASLPMRLVEHAWNVEQETRARARRGELRQVIHKLSDILAADFARSEEGRSAERLRASVGAAHAETFDFGAMSRVLTKAAPRAALPAARRERIRWLLMVIESERFYPMATQSGASIERYGFVFDSCTAALAAYRERLPKAVMLAKAVAMAELEIAGEFKESQHAVFFEGFGEDGLGARELALFPDYLVRTNARDLDALEASTLMEMLSAGLPVKVLVQSDDILGPSAAENGHATPGLPSDKLANMAIGLNAAYVMQACSANLFSFRAKLHSGLAYRGPALFSVFSGANDSTDEIPPYLVSAAALESRAFPAFAFDPSAGSDWASRFDVEGNPQAELDWPVHEFGYEDENHQAVCDRVAFTFADFAACDCRYARHLASIPRSNWSADMAPAASCLAGDSRGLPEKVPCLLMVDSSNALHKVIVDEKLMREARRCRDAWHSLQELGGIHNSHAARVLARENKAREERERAEAKAPVQAPAQPAAAPAAPAAAPAPAEGQAEKPSDEAYIETARCTSCNECTNVNPKMFAYNENKQAYIKDLTAGTYAQLVEAAESCQVSIIHPGKPRDPSEPDLEALMKRAEPFR
ncbi:MAG TPA: ferredoxin [Casimicrobiaceae bacterium]|nr:ferredoxin [Casimicrobiaceae bacterium]